MYRLFKDGKFGDAHKAVRQILHSIPLLVVETRREVDEVKELLTIARCVRKVYLLVVSALNLVWHARHTSTTRDYDVALRTELKRKEIKDDPKRAMELAAYLTHCKLQPVHLALCLRLAYTVFYKCKNLGLCATFCRRLLELNPGQQVLNG